MDRWKSTPMKVQDPEIRSRNFDEVGLGYTKEEAIKEANRCIQCPRPLCMSGCPVSIDIPRFIRYISEDEFEKSAYVLSKQTSLASVCGRVCPQEDQCEKLCILGKRGEPVAIGKLERFIGDWAIENEYHRYEKIEKNGHKVAVVGAGPAGITCAGDLAKRGYEVTIFEALHEPGGVLQYGIPEFRLPKNKIVKAEVDNVKRLGVKLETNVVVGRTITIDEMFEEGFEAIFLASGAGLPRFMGIPGENYNGVFSANEFLTRANLMKAYKDDYATPISIGEKVAVIGGGNVAMDAARTARRLGSDVTIVYRRTEEELPARSEEVHHAKEEGIKFKLLANPVRILGNEEGRVSRLRCVQMELGKEDRSGRRRPVKIKDSEFDIEIDTVIMALGSAPNPLIAKTTEGLKVDSRGCIIIDERTAETSRDGVFAGGDIVTGAATVIQAMGAGKKAATGINEYIQNKQYENKNK